MPIKITDQAPNPVTIDDWTDGSGWIAHQNETMERATHALDTKSGVWLLDPLDVPNIRDRTDPMGDLAGIFVGFSHHWRDADTIASDHDIPIHTATPLATNPPPSIDSNVEVIETTGRLPGTEFEVIPIRNWPGWREFGLYNENIGTIYIPESVGTAQYFLAGEEWPGIHPMARWWPPRGPLSQRPCQRLRFGHGRGCAEAGFEQLQKALKNARRRLPRAYWNAFQALV